MTVYSVLVIYILLCGGVIYSMRWEQQKKDVIFLNCAFLAIFLLFSLRNSCVGADTPHYEVAYSYAGNYDWFDFKYIYFEPGYILLTKICTSIGMSFQVFLTLVNIFILFPIYFFIRKYSENKFFSVIIYIGYTFFEFNLTAIRQSIAASIVLIAIIVLNDSTRKKLFKFCCIVLFATLFHKGAFVAFLFAPFYFIKKPKIYYMTSIALCFVFIVGRSYIMEYIKGLFDKDTLNSSAGLYIGLNALFLVGLLILFAFGRRNSMWWAQSFDDEELHHDKSMMQMEKLYCLGVSILFLFGADTSVRSAMILYQVVIVLLPNELKYIFDAKSRQIFEICAICFFIVFLYVNSLIPNSLYLVPYRFFWQSGVR